MELLILVLTAVLLARLEKERPEVDLTPGSSRLAGFRASRGRGGTMAASLCVSAAALSLKGGRGERRAESGESASLHSAWRGKWDAFTRPWFWVRVSEVEFTQPDVF